MEPTFTHDWFSPNIPVLEKHLAGLKGKPITALEIGCFEGRSTIWFLENILTHPESTLVCVDPFTGSEDHVGLVSFDGVRQRFEENVRQCGRSVVIEPMRSDEFFATRSETRDFDFVYVDGSHKMCDVIVDGFCSFFCLKPRGLIVFDDYEWGQDRKESDRPGPGIDIFLKVFGDRIDLVHKGYQVIVRKK